MQLSTQLIMLFIQLSTKSFDKNRFTSASYFFMQTHMPSHFPTNNISYKHSHYDSKNSKTLYDYLPNTTLTSCAI
ncbi:hypothetical protein lam_849 [Candidatus Liberibacter americanus str. Sao Paulo]|uniref:Uncharacterized protein n=1 Tax=Candidatus Liberibacter americanus str. Sao Paulo TaxID=1261131 RepID=U6B5R6_9HYPH|nr:hypothetical protein lam_849 [Candidatus Liberibacter americanus str. Sao Paulo]